MGPRGRVRSAAHQLQRRVFAGEQRQRRVPHRSWEPQPEQWQHHDPVLCARTLICAVTCFYSLILRPFPPHVGLQFECWPQFINTPLCSLPSPAQSSRNAAFSSRPPALLYPPLHCRNIQLICLLLVRDTFMQCVSLPQIFLFFLINKWLPSVRGVSISARWVSSAKGSPRKSVRFSS